MPGELEAEILGEAEEFAIVHMVEKYKEGVIGPDGEETQTVFPEVYSAVQSVMGCSISEIMKAYDNVINGFFWKTFQ